MHRIPRSWGLLRSPIHLIHQVTVESDRCLLLAVPDISNPLDDLHHIIPDPLPILQPLQLVPIRGNLSVQHVSVCPSNGQSHWPEFLHFPLLFRLLQSSPLEVDVVSVPLIEDFRHLLADGFCPRPFLSGIVDGCPAPNLFELDLLHGVLRHLRIRGHRGRPSFVKPGHLFDNEPVPKKDGEVRKRAGGESQ